MKCLPLFLFLMLGYSSLATNALLDLKDARLSVGVYSNRTVVLQPMSTPTVSSPSVVLGGQIVVTNDVNGQNWYSNIYSGLYHVIVLAPPDRADFAFLVTATNLGNINVADNLVAASTATFPAGSVAWAAAVSDQRYARGSNQPVSFSMITNGLGYTPQPSAPNLTNYSTIGTNLVAVLTNGNVFTVSNRFANTFINNLWLGGFDNNEVLGTVDGTSVVPFTAGNGISFSGAQITLAQNGATNGQVQAWNGTQYLPVTFPAWQPASANLTNWSITPTNLILVNATNNDQLLGTTITNGGLLQLSNYIAAITPPSGSLWTNDPNIGLTPAFVPGNRFNKNIAFAQTPSSGVELYMQEPAGTNGIILNAAKGGNQLTFFFGNANDFSINGDTGNIDMIKKLSYSWPSAYGPSGSVLSDTTGSGSLSWVNVLANATNNDLALGTSLSNYVNTTGLNATNYTLTASNSLKAYVDSGNLANAVSLANYSNTVNATKQAGSSVLTNISGASGTPSSATFLRGDYSWQTPVGVGTVTSVGLTMPGEFAVSGSPVTSSGSFTVAKQNQSPNLVYAGPSSGGSGAPTFRALVTADLPTIPTSGWQLTGNAGTTPGANFIGTTDNQPLMIKINGTQAGIIRGGGSITMGDSSSAVANAYDSVLCGQNNVIITTAPFSANVIAGGTGGRINGGTFSVISGGSGNVIGASTVGGTVAGGASGTVNGNYGFVAGGANNRADGTFSLAAGNDAHAENQGSFVWGDSQSGVISSTNNDSFNVRAKGGVILYQSPLFAQTNYAPYSTLTNPVASGASWANSTGARVLLCLNYTLTSTNGFPGLCLTNLTTGEWFNATNSVTNSVFSGRTDFMLSPNDTIIVTNRSSSSASASLDASWAKMQ